MNRMEKRKADSDVSLSDRALRGRARRMPRFRSIARAAIALIYGALLLLPLQAWRIPELEAGKEEAQEFLPARRGYEFRFPRDHRPHHGYRTEWWYYTGFLRTEDGERFGWQFTIFKVEQAPNPSGAFRTNDVFFMAHIALSDEARGEYFFSVRIQRLFPGLAGYDAEANELYLADNQLSIAVQPNGESHRIRARADRFALDLELRSRSGPVVHGEDGVSVKGFDRDNVSHYYSVTDLKGTAKLRRLDERGRITSERSGLAAKAWMDHEFASNALAEDQTGWDWLHFTLEDGVQYMLFRVRSNQPGRDYVYGSKIQPNGSISSIPREGIRFEALERWTSPESGGRYPVRWRITADGREFEMEAWFRRQEALPAFSQADYWEGAVDVRETNSDAELQGTGYLEMTGYAESMQGRL